MSISNGPTAQPRICPCELYSGLPDTLLRETLGFASWDRWENRPRRPSLGFGCGLKKVFGWMCPFIECFGPLFWDLTSSFISILPEHVPSFWTPKRQAVFWTSSRSALRSKAKLWPSSWLGSHGHTDVSMYMHMFSLFKKYGHIDRNK